MKCVSVCFDPVFQSDIYILICIRLYTTYIQTKNGGDLCLLNEIFTQTSY